jgi:hypothetical protein
VAPRQNPVPPPSGTRWIEVALAAAFVAMGAAGLLLWALA